jgi:hypothetical protein
MIAIYEAKPKDRGRRVKGSSKKKVTEDDAMSDQDASSSSFSDGRSVQSRNLSTNAHPLKNYIPDRFRSGADLARKLNIKPGEDGYFRWYTISNTFPIVAASLGPLSNLNAIVALANPWRIDLVTGDKPGDTGW